MNKIISRNNKKYEIVNPIEYVKYLKNAGTSEIVAEKSAYVLARKAAPGEKITVYTSNGHVESKETAKEGQWLLTRANKCGNPVIDSHGNQNQWLVNEETFNKNYDTENMTELGLAKPRGIPQRFIQVDKDIAIMVPWGPNEQLIPQTIDRGGYINFGNPNDTYGIGQEEFLATYSPV